jgi:heavy metal translocating P-type ATPase
VLTSYFVPVITLIAIATWLIWLGLGLSGTLPLEYLDVQVGGWPFWSLQFAIAVFIVACPCGIGLAAPTALFVGGGLAAKHGILVKGGGEAFQEASGLDIIIFDKTGTLTQGGEPEITDHQFLTPDDGIWEHQTIVSVLGELEGNSSHPLGKAVAAFSKGRNATSSKAKAIEETPGKGMKGSFSVEGLAHPIEVLAGNQTLMDDHEVSFGADASATLDAWKAQAKSVILVAARPMPPALDSPWTPLIILAASDPIRPEARPVIEALGRHGVEVWMISGDNPTTAVAVGAAVGIPEERVLAGVLPEQKADKVKHLQRSRAKSRSRFRFAAKTRATVAMVGDGVNDSPALTAADVGIAIGSGSDVAISAAEFVLVSPSLTTLLTLTTLSRTVFNRVIFNFGWAVVYNLVALPIAAGVLYPVVSNGQHIRLDPVWASLAMALSSISVICSSLLLRSRLPLVGFRG